MKNILWGAVLCIAAQPALAQETECVKIDADLDRLACYDKQNGRTPAIEVKADPTSEWITRTQVSKLTDQKGVYLSVSSKEDVSCRWNNDKKALLTIRCHENTTSIYISTECHMVSSDYNDYGKVNYRIDSNLAKSVDMDESTDNKALGLWSGGKSIPFIKEMMGGSKFVARFTPYNDSPVIMEFNISELDKAILPVREQCKW